MTRVDPVVLSDPRPINVTGCLVPFLAEDDTQPHLFRLPDCGEHWVLVFTDPEKLAKHMAQLGAAPSSYRIKRITDGYDFLLSIYESACRVALDPSLDFAQGTTRWTEIVPDGRGQA